MSILTDAIDKNRKKNEETGSAGAATEQRSVLRQAIDRSRAGETVEAATGAQLPQPFRLHALPGSDGVRQNTAARPAASAESETSRRGTFGGQRGGGFGGTMKTEQGPRRTTKGGFYSQPELGADTERLRSAAQKAETTLKSKQQELESAAARLSELETGVKSSEERLKTMQGMQGELASRLSQSAYEDYQTRYGEYEKALEGFNGLYAEYEPLLAAYNEAADAYNGYLDQQQKEYGAWRGTIRAEDAVQADIAATDAQIAELEKQKKALANTRAGVQQYQRRARGLGGSDTDARLLDIDAQLKEMDAQLEQAQAMKELLQEEMDWSRYYRYDDLKGAEDYDALSEYVSTANGQEKFNAWSGTYTNTGFDDITYDYINRNEDARSRQGLNDIQSNASFLGLDDSFLQEMTDDEVGTFNYLYAKEGKDAAYAYIEYLTGDLNYRQRQKAEADWAKYAKESPVASSVFSVLESPLKGLSYLGQFADYTADGKIDQNAGYNKFSYANSAIRNEVSNIVEDKWGSVGTFAYQTGMSMGDFLFNTAVSGGNQGLALAIMGTGAAADGTIRAKDRGLSDNQAFAIGTIAGAAEIVTEKLSLDALLKGKWEDGALKYILKNTLTEGGEEVGSSLINLTADVLIAKDKSEWAQSIEAYKAQGMTEQEAFNQAFIDQALSMGLDFLGGAISGGVMAGTGAGIGTITNSINERAQQRQQERQDLQEHAEEAQRLERVPDGVVLPTAEEAYENGGRTEQTPAGPVRQEQQETQERQDAAEQFTQRPGTLPTAEEADQNQRAQRAATELERTGILSGMEQEGIEQAQRISRAIGRDIVFYRQGATGSGIRNGYYSAQDGKIYVNAESKNPLAQIISHELTHSVELADAYGDLSGIVLRRIQDTGADLQQLRQAKQELYARNGVRLGSEVEIDQEIVAEYVEKYLLTDEGSIMELTRENRTLGEKIMRWLNSVLAKLGNSSAQERAFLTNARDIYARALSQTQTSFTEQTEQAEPVQYQQGAHRAGDETEPRATAQETAEQQRRREARETLEWLRGQYAAGEITEEEFDAALDAILEEEGLAGEEMLERNSFGGVNANRADLGELRRAQEMERRGVAAEIILKETGWFTGADGKWRFEIDDSGMEYHERRTEEGAVPGQTLADYIAHDELFKNYPQLRKVGLEFAEMERGVNGQYDPETNTITLSNELRSAPEATLVHEVQHAIQRAEGFARGSNTNFWNRMLDEGYDGRTQMQRRERQRLWQEYNSLREDEPEFFEDMNDLDAMTPDMPRGEINWDTLEQIEEDPVEWQRYDAAREAMEEKYGDMKVFDFIDLRYKLKQSELTGGRTATDLYYDTAGEIEARDSARRRSMTGEERRAKMPDTGNEDTVFVESADEWDGASYSISETDDGRAVAVVDSDILSDIDTVTWDTAKKEKAKRAAKTALLAFKDGVQVNGIRYKVNKTSRDEFTRSRDTERKYHRAPDTFADKMRAAANADDIITATTDWARDGGLKHPRMDNLVDFEHGKVLLQAGENQYEADTVVGITDGGEYVFYDVVDMEPTSFKTKEEPSLTTAFGKDAVSAIQEDSSVDSVADTGLPVKERFSISEDSEGQELSEQQKEYFKDSAVRDAAGRLVVLYHQTEGDFTVFETGRDGAGKTDHETPTGIFLKPTERDIGLRGKKQMPLYANITNPLQAYDREQLARWYSDNIPGYRETAGQIAEIDKEYGAKFDEARRTFRNFLIEWRKQNPDAGRRAAYDAPGFEEAYNAEENVLDEWTAKADEARKAAKALLDDYFSASDYDGVHLLQDVGSFGRSVETWIAFDSAQVKNTDNKAPTDDRDIRYSIDEEGPLEAKLPGGEEQDITASMPVKAQAYLKRMEQRLLYKVGEVLSVPRVARREFLQSIVRDISTEYLETGRVSQETVDELFDRAWDEGIEVDSAFYDEYKFVKDYLRTQAVTIADLDKEDIADFNDFRKRAFGTLRIVNDGGLPVDVAYQELQSMAGELFPHSLMHPGDQLSRMYEVARSIEKVERTLDEVHSDDAEEFKRWAKHDFDVAVNDALSELRIVKRFVDERAQKATAEEPVTQEEVKAMYAQLKEARRAYEKAAAKNLLTAHDEAQVGRLLRGEMELDLLDPKKDNVKGITAVYEAKKEYERLTRGIKKWNQARRAAMRDEADAYLETANGWKDKKAGILYSRETMERNIRDIVKDEELAEEIIGKYFKPVHDAAAEANKTKNAFRDRVRALDLSRKVEKGNEVSEAHAVQLLGEAEDNIRMLEQSRGRMKTRDGKSLEDWRSVVEELWKSSPQLDEAKIRAAVKEFRSIYDELFLQMNEARVRNGYEPVNYRKGYFPHFQPGDNDGILAQFGKALGIDTEVAALPTTINGLTHTFKPGMQWFGHAQERLGFNTAYDAVEGFDKYIEGVADVIHQTDNIQRLRAFATQARYRTSDEGIKKQVDTVRENTSLSEEDKQNRIEKIYETGRSALSNFVVELEEYTNLLANKKSRADRNMEQALGRRMYNLMKALESRVAANMVAVNPASWLTNFIPLTQGGATLDRGMLLRGMWDTLKAYKESDGIVSKSAFLTNRRGSDPLVRTWAQAASAKMSAPMEYIDQFTADSLVRARYRQNLGKGLSEDAAMSEADAWVSGVMADRSKGSTPTLFNRSNPLTKVFTQFQLEVNNQLSYLFKDMPRDAREKGVRALVAALIKFMLGAFLYNEVYEYVIGRRPSLDPLGILNDTVGDMTGYELPNLVELGAGAATGEIPSFQTEQKGAYETVAGIAGSVAEELPFIGGVLGGGRVPISSALPDWERLGRAALSDDWDAKKRVSTAAKELGNPLTYLALPFGGGQLKKIFQGLKATVQGGSYTVNSQGEDELQYPVYNDTPGQAAGNAARAILFGKTSLPTAREWIEGGFKSMGAKETACYQGMLEAGVPGKDAYELLKTLRGAEKTETESKARQERRLLQKSDIDGAGKSIVYYGLMASESEQKLMDEMADMGADMGEVTGVLMEIKDAGDLKGAAASNAKRDAIAGSALTDEEKIALYRDRVSDSRDDDIAAFQKAGMDFDQFLKAHSEYTTINEEYDGAGQKATEFSRWVNSQTMTAEQAETMKECFTYFSQIPAKAGRYDSFTAAGLDDDAAYKLANTLDGLEPAEGEESVSSLQKYRAVVDSGLSEDDQMAALGELMTDAEYSKMQTGRSFGVSPGAYVAYRERLPMYDADGNGTFKQDEVTAALQSMMAPNEVKAALWQMANKSWKPKNNPFSTSVGGQVYNALNADDDGGNRKAGGIVLPTGSEGYTGGIVLPKA